MKKTGLLFLLFFPLLAGSLFAQSPQSYQLSTHVLDTSLGKPAAGVCVALYKMNLETREFEFVDAGHTDQQGRINGFLPSGTDHYGVYKLRFDTAPYFENQQISSIYPYIEVIFILEGEEHYHIPITVSANGYSTYRGS